MCGLGAIAGESMRRRLALALRHKVVVRVTFVVVVALARMTGSAQEMGELMPRVSQP